MLLVVCLMLFLSSFLILLHFIFFSEKYTTALSVNEVDRTLGIEVVRDSSYIEVVAVKSIKDYRFVVNLLKKVPKEDFLYIFRRYNDDIIVRLKDRYLCINYHYTFINSFFFYLHLFYSLDLMHLENPIAKSLKIRRERDYEASNAKKEKLRKFLTRDRDN